MKKYDLIVIGSGGGAKLVSPTAKMGLKVAAIERDALGGTCLNRGCIPSKMLIHPADVAVQLKEAAKFDLHFNTAMQVNFERLISRISQTVDGDSQKISVGYNKNPNIDYMKGQAEFVSNKVIRVNGEDLTADKIFISVGARPNIPDIPGLAGTPFMTSTEALRNPKLPKKMIIVGGGYIAVELGHAYGALGCEVHFIVRHGLVGHEDQSVIEEFTKVFSKQYQVHFKTVVTTVEFKDGMFSATLKDETGHQKNMQADALLIAVGIVSNADTLKLKSTEIKSDDKNFISVNEFLETNVPGVYALGDCIGRYFYRHSVNFEGEYLMRTLYHEKKREPIQYPPVPHAIFTHPQVAGVGSTEAELKAAGIDYVVGMNSYASSAMGMALLSDHGFVKILIERRTRKILGAHIIGAEASNMIHLLIAFMTKNGTLDDLLNMIYVHPALPEIVRNAARKAQLEFEKS